MEVSRSLNGFCPCLRCVYLTSRAAAAAFFFLHKHSGKLLSLEGAGEKKVIWENRHRGGAGFLFSEGKKGVVDNDRLAAFPVQKADV